MSGESNFPYKLTPLKEEDQKEVIDKFLGYSGGMVEVEGGRHVMPSHYDKFAHKYYNFKFVKDDVLIMTFPRSGTTWTQEIVWLMRNNVDTETAQRQKLGVRSPFIEFDSLHPLHMQIPEEMFGIFKEIHPDKDLLTEGFHVTMANHVKSPRTIKTHLPLSLVNPTILDTSKVVYVARNPKDVCVSYYHQQRLVKVAEFKGNFAEYVDFWCRDLILQAPYWSHVSEAWAQRDHPNMHFMFYEDMKKDIMKELRRLDTFLETNLTDEQLTQVINYTEFSTMKTRAAPQARVSEQMGFTVKGEADFMRKGTTKDWINYFTPDLDAKFQNWLSKGGDIVQQMPFIYTAQD